MSSHPKISFIIPVLYLQRPLNKKRFFMPRSTIKDVLEDITKNVNTSYEIIVICNSTEDKLVNFIKKNKTITKYVLNSTNPGVARSWNMGAEMAEGKYLCFVNDDVRIGKNSIEQLEAVLDTKPEVGEVGPRGDLYENGKSKRFVGLENPETADVISGYLFMVRSDTYSKVGGFDTFYTPAGYEEVDFSFSIRKMGQKCLVLPNLDIVHNEYHGVSSFKSTINFFNASIETNELHERNKRYFFEKWGFHE
jgi:GT2 family glycosyltransferase